MDFLDILDFFDMIVSPFIDLFTGRLRFIEWLRRVALFLLFVGSVALAFFGWESKTWLFLLLGIGGTAFFGYHYFRADP